MADFMYIHPHTYMKIIDYRSRRGLMAKIDKKLPMNAEKTVALRKLLESKDCAVRAILFEDK